MRRTAPTLLAVGALVIIGAILILAIALPRQVAAPDTTPTPTVTPSPSATATPTASASPSPSPTPTVAAVTRYASAGLGYSIETPPPWHRSICSPRVVTQQGEVPANEIFVPVSARDEAGTDTGTAYPTIVVIVEANPQGLTPRQWAEQGRSVGSTVGERIEDVVYADRPAARKVLAGTPLATYFVANGGRMYVVTRFGPPPDAATQQTMIRIIESFRFLSDVEIAAARAALPTPAPPRTPEQVADGVAAAFAAKDADAVGTFLAACVTTAAEQAGAGSVSREKYVSDLRAAFAAGLTVTVQPRPFQGDRAAGSVSIMSTWRDSRGTRERRMMITRGENDRWELLGTVDRLF